MGDYWYWRSTMTTLDLIDADGHTLRQRCAVEGNLFYEHAAACGTSKLFHPAYMHAYWVHLGPLRHLPLKLLEIGVAEGNSLRCWRRCFPHARIYGLDKNPEALAAAPEGVSVWVGRQESAPYLEGMMAYLGVTLDVVIDDGSHEPAHQQVTLRTLWPYLAPGGWYVVEDLEYSYRDGVPGPETTVAALKDQIDFVNRDYVHRYTNLVVRSPLEGLAEMHFYPNACFLRKGVAP